MKLEEYIQYDATALAEMVKNKEIEKQELIALSEKQAEMINDDLNAITRKRERVYREINEAIEDRPFEGVPIYLKDLSQNIKGDLEADGIHLPGEKTVKHTSKFVESLHDAGFLSVGYSTSPQFGIKNITEPALYGPTRNPWQTKYSPGGSSGGAASLVASGVVPVAAASDGGGSIRIPASFTSLVGLKPTRGRIPIGPGIGRQGHGSSISFVLSKSVRDSARLLTSMQTLQEDAAFQTPLFPGKYDEMMEKPLHKNIRIGFTTTSPVGTPVSTEAKMAVIKLAKWLENEGFQVEEAENKVDGKQLMRDYYTANSVGIASIIRQMEKRYGRTFTAEDVEIETWLLKLAGEKVSGIDVSNCFHSWDRAAAKMARYYERYDFYITPTTAYAAPQVGELTHDDASVVRLREQAIGLDGADLQELVYDMFLPSLTYTPYTQLANLTGQPAISVPIHLTEEGLPLGVQIMAEKGAEDKLLQLAYKLEQSDLWVGMKGNPYFEGI